MDLSMLHLDKSISLWANNKYVDETEVMDQRRHIHSVRVAWEILRTTKLSADGRPIDILTKGCVLKEYF